MVNVSLSVFRRGADHPQGEPNTDSLCSGEAAYRYFVNIVFCCSWPWSAEGKGSSGNAISGGRFLEKRASNRLVYMREGLTFSNMYNLSNRI